MLLWKQSFTVYFIYAPSSLQTMHIWVNFSLIPRFVGMGMRPKPDLDSLVHERLPGYDTEHVYTGKDISAIVL